MCIITVARHEGITDCSILMDKKKWKELDSLSIAPAGSRIQFAEDAQFLL